MSDDDLCGAETTSGEPCQNAAESCPWHDTDETPDAGRPTKLNPDRQENILESIESGNSIRASCEKCGIPRQTFYKWLQRGKEQNSGKYAKLYSAFQEVWYDEYDHAEHCEKTLPTGEDHGNWSGDNRDYRGPHWHTQRKKALERDEYKCQSCGQHDKDHRQKHDYGLHVHHIVSRRNFTHDDPEQNALENLITLCHQCHDMYEGTNLSPVERVES